MKRLALLSLCALCALLIATTAFAQQTRTFVPVQDGYTREAQAVATFAPDRIVVQFSPSAHATVQIHRQTNKNADGAGAWTGLASFDTALEAIDVRGLRSAHPDLKPGSGPTTVGADRWYIFDVAVGTDIEGMAERLATDPNVEYAMPDLYAFPAVSPNDPYFPNNWGHDNTAQMPAFDWGGSWSHTGSPVGTVGFDTNARSAWNETQGYGDASVVIAILDSGVDVGHPDLLQVPGYDFGDGDNNPDDDSADPGHGTACAGIAAGIADNGLGVAGIAGGCSIMPLKVSDSAGNLSFTYITNAIYHAADNGADVISMSFGAATYSVPSTDAALTYAYNAGVVMFAATGNENDSTIGYPSVNSNVISVGAASPCGGRKRSGTSTEVNPGVTPDPNGSSCDEERWWGSNYGTTIQDSRYAVDVIAPTILHTTDIQGSGGYENGDYSGFFNGTSCATPYAAGVAALVKSKNPTWGPAQIRAQLTSTAIDIVDVEAGAGWDRYTGYGLVDAAAAVGAVLVLPPTAAFDADVTSGCAPMTVEFTDTSTGAVTSWSWSFGDGGTSTQQNPTHTYTTPGLYDVRLTATGPEGSDMLTLNDYITVGTLPTADFVSGAASGPAPLNVTFIDASTDATSRLWDFGDGATSTEQYPTHTYTSTGSYTVTLIAYGDCADTLTRVDYVTVTDVVDPPVAAFSGDPLTGCAPLDVTFTDESTGAITSWSWDFGDGNTSTDQDPAHQYAAPGTFTVELTVTGPGGSDTASTTDYVTVTEPVVAAFSTPDTAGVAPYAAQFTDASTGVVTGWYWDFGDGNTDTAQSPLHTYTAAGTYTVMLVVDGACGTDTLTVADMVVVTDPPAPVADFAGDPLSGCAPMQVAFTDASSGDVTSWAWTFGDGNSSTDQNPGHEYTASGLYTVELTVTGPGGSDTMTKTDYVTVSEPVSAAFSVSDDTGLAPFAVDFTDESTGNPTWWRWDFGDAVTDTVQNPSHTYTTVDSFTVKLVVGNDCSVDSVTVVSAVRVVGVSGTPDIQPVAYRLGQNVPNPFNPMTTIYFELPKQSKVRLSVYDLSGRLVRSLVSGESMGAGRHEEVWNGKNDAGQQVSAGVYFYHLNAGEFSQTKRMTLVK